jgi:hypothetical protein
MFFFGIYNIGYTHLGPFVDVSPIDIGHFLTTRFSSSSSPTYIVLVKIDTEGYEPIILDAILNVSNGTTIVVQNFIIEVTSKLWPSFQVYTSKTLCTIHTLLSIYQRFPWKRAWPCLKDCSPSSNIRHAGFRRAT